MTVNLSFMTVLFQATSVSAEDCVLAHPIVPVEECKPGFFLLPGTHSCYQLVTEKLSWEASRTRCASLTSTSHLAEIDNAEEDTAVAGYLNSLDFINTDANNCLSVLKSMFFIAGQRIDPTVCASTTDFVWKPRDGETKEMTYINWRTGEPNCGGTGGEHCLVYYTRDYTTLPHLWNDISCTIAYCSLCEDSSFIDPYRWP